MMSIKTRPWTAMVPSIANRSDSVKPWRERSNTHHTNTARNEMSSESCTLVTFGSFCVAAE